jgi:hypothetical protein
MDDQQEDDSLPIEPWLKLATVLVKTTKDPDEREAWRQWAEESSMVRSHTQKRRTSRPGQMMPMNTRGLDEHIARREREAKRKRRR